MHLLDTAMHATAMHVTAMHDKHMREVNVYMSNLTSTPLGFVPFLMLRHIHCRLAVHCHGTSELALLCHAALLHTLPKCTGC